VREDLPSEIRAHQRQISKPWRWCFVVYALGLTIGTHWPRLEFGPEIPATDKTIHLLAFGGATVLLRLTRWVPNIWFCGVIVFCWSYFDELSQNLPGLHRSSHWHDMVANGLGVAVACAWMWALAPVGAKFSDGQSKDGPNRLRLRALAFSFNMTFTRFSAWVAGAVGAAAGIAALLACWTYLPMRWRRSAVLIAVFIALLTAAHFWWRQWRAEFKRALAQKPCLHCGNVTAPRDQGCPQCGMARSPCDWQLPQAPARSMAFRLTLRPAALALLVLILGFSLILLTPFAYAWLLDGGQGSSGSIFAMRFARSFGRLPRELVSVIDLSLYLLLFAAGMRIYRAQLAKFYDRAVVCARCGHDLRGTPTVGHTGQCGECGAPFTRTST
jgi:hypothetical protein